MALWQRDHSKAIHYSRKVLDSNDLDDMLITRRKLGLISLIEKDFDTSRQLWLKAIRYIFEERSKHGKTITISV